MNKKIVISILILLVGVLFMGCNKESKKNAKDAWIINLDVSQQEIDNAVKKVFEAAKAKHSGSLDYIALLGKQVVAGTNYMFLCKDDVGYKVAIIYKDLEGNSQITKVSVFDPVKYVNKKSSYSPEQLAGGWYTEIPENMTEVDPKIKRYFNEANEKLAGGNYFPIAVLAEQYKSGINYALLSYGEASYEGNVPRICMLVLSVDEDRNAEIVSITDINLADFNK